MSRAKGWRLPANAVKVDRATRFGNPYRVGAPVDLRQIRRWGWNISPAGRCHVCSSGQEAVDKFRHALFWDSAIHEFVRTELGGKDLACWCALDHACHADVLLEIANSTSEEIDREQRGIDDKIIGASTRLAGLPKQ